jgi:hypothetical protein
MTDDPAFARPDDPLASLRERIHATREAAEHLAAQAAQALQAERNGGVPPRGWATPHEREETRSELQAMVALLEALRDLVPPELQHQVREVLRQVLLLIRAIIDWWVDRIDVQRGAEPEIEDIPIS